MNTALRFTDPIEIADAILTTGRRGQITKVQPDGDATDRIAMLISRGLTRGLSPNWSLRKPIGKTFTQAELDEISRSIAQGYNSGTDYEGLETWRLEVRI